MTRLVVLCVAVGWLGAALLLDELRWFRRPTLTDRLRPFVAGGQMAPPGGPSSLRGVVTPSAQRLGTLVASSFGVREDLAVRLERIHAEGDPASFRLRQLGWATASLGLAVLASLSLALPPLLALGVLLGAPLLSFLLLEQQLASTSAAWQRRLFLELPVITEQLGMLLSAGYSLTGALHRIAARGDGACVRDLRRVLARTQQGLSDVDALREWAELAKVPALDRLVAVLALNREAGDLGRLIAEEARSMRKDAHRELLATIERRAQQVWIPVTVATLVPGVLFLAVPFVDALQLFTGG